MIRVVSQIGSGATYGVTLGAGLIASGPAGTILLVFSSLIAAVSMACMRCES